MMPVGLFQALQGQQGMQAMQAMAMHGMVPMGLQAMPLPKQPAVDPHSYSATDLNERPINKSKRHELQPDPEGVLVNFSDMGAKDLPDSLELPLFDKDWVPPAPAWFVSNGVSGMEVQALARFGGLLRPEADVVGTYISTRNAIVERYRREPLRYLGVTRCVGLGGDIPIESLALLHGYLELWGLINLVPPMPTDDLLDNHCYYLSHYRRTIAAGGAGVEEDVTNLQDTCLNCGAEPYVIYRCVRLKCLQLCPDCFLEGRYPLGLSSKDFVKMLSGNRSFPTGSGEQPWTNREHAALLAALEQDQVDDWDAIAARVGNGRTKAQCVTRFLQLPIGERGFEPVDYVEEEKEEEEGTPKEKKEEEKGGFSVKDTPLADHVNPLVSLLLILVRSINPVIASAGAREVLRHMSTTTSEAAAVDHLNLSDIALAGCVRQARLIALEYQQTTAKLIEGVTELELKKIETKLRLYEATLRK
ncbi:hypothetical protein HK101_009837 [Irineochytrium annulatum]|nr:hypothetical protein HK101_009837 [Irineochytrium annulatum]